jgi:hypothetical protein
MRVRVAYLLTLMFVIMSTNYSNAAVHSVNWDLQTNRKVVKHWIDALEKVPDISSTTYMRKCVGGKDSLHKSKHRELIVWIPDETDLNKEFTVVVWFHGHRGYDKVRTFEDRILKQFSDQSKLKNLVIVIPELPWSIHTSTPTKRNGMVWTNPGDFLKFIDQVNDILIFHNAGRTVKKPEYRIVGHSAGGSVIARLAKTGDLCQINPALIVWSDSSYGQWLKSSWNGCLGTRSDILTRVFVLEGDSPWKRAMSFMGEFKIKPTNLKVFVMRRPQWSHRLIGNNIVKLSKLLGDL